MYSDELEKLFARRGITPGDRVKVAVNGMTFEGILMPRPEFGDNGTLVLKLPNGYNVGMHLGKRPRLEKINGKRAKFEFPKAKLERKEGLPDVTIIATGGTIGAKVDYETGGVHWLLDPEELLYTVPELKGIANYRVVNLMSIGSEDMMYRDWQEIAKTAAKELSRSRGVVITTGTDTMHYTSAALSFMLRGINGPVVITGSQRSSDRGSSDAFMNLACAARIAANANVAEVGVCMHATSSDTSCNFIRGTKVRKMHTTRRDAFRPIDSPTIANVTREGEITYTDEQRVRIKDDGRELHMLKGYEPRVALLKFYPNADPEIIDHYLEKKYRGLIIEGTGMGHVAVSPHDAKYSWLSHIKRAVDSGMIVGITSQTINGRVNPNVYTNGRLILGAGAIYCEDMLPEVALVKLGVLLGNHRRQEAAQLLTRNIAGEISERSEVGLQL